MSRDEKNREKDGVEKRTDEDRLKFYGGKYSVFIPIILALFGLTYIAVKNANIPEYWVVFLLPMIVMMPFAKNKRKYSEAIINGFRSDVGMILIGAVILAGISGAILNQSGLVKTLAYYMVGLNLVGSKYITATFILTCLIAFSTGTSVGTIFVVGPILYPVGYLVGASPAFLIGAIVSGGAFGDNLSPVSDTTIASAATQEVDLGGVVKSRLKYSIPAAVITIFLYFIFSGSGTMGEGVEEYLSQPEPISLLFLLVPAVIVYFAFQQRHLFEALSYGIIVGLVLGIATGIIPPQDIISVPEPFGAGGIILEGIQNAIPTVIVVLVLFAQINILKEGGGIDIIMEKVGNFVRGPKTAELSMSSLLIVLNLITGLNTAAIIGSGEIAKKLGKKYKIDGYRRANILDCAGTTFNYLLPYMVPVVVGSMVASMYAPVENAVQVSPVQVVTHQFYPWVMLAVLLFSIFTGYGRTFISDEKTAVSKNKKRAGGKAAAVEKV
ncbi:MAG: Na+/H+ antiporter NhaC family protein [Bacillota bacterium]